jgi:hypothetical protein
VFPKRVILKRENSTVVGLQETPPKIIFWEFGSIDPIKGKAHVTPIGKCAMFVYEMQGFEAIIETA